MSSITPFNDNNNIYFVPSFTSSASEAKEWPSSSILTQTIDQSKILNTEEKKFYSQMIQCVDQFGINDDFQLFIAAGYCFDTDFKSKTKNMISVAEFLSFVGENVNENLGLNNDYINANYFAHDRPGFFLLTAEQHPKVYFLREGADGSLVYFDPNTDQFVCADSIPTKGDEKLVVLNKNKFPKEKTYFSSHTPNEPVNGSFYHEEQNSGKCAVHSCHAFLGFPAINETQLGLIKLEEIVQAEVKNHHKDPENSGWNFNSASSQLSDYIRFQHIQGGSFQADAGSNADHIATILQQMASAALIDKKYGSFTKLTMSGKHQIKFAKENKIDFDNDSYWNENDLTLILEKIEERLDFLQKNPALDVEIIAPKNFAQMPSFKQDYILYQISLRQDYEKLTSLKDSTVNQLKALNDLKKIFQDNDRLFIASNTEVHCFAMRKAENGSWVVIDSLVKEQIKTDKPFEWLIERQKSFLKLKQGFNYDFLAIL